MAPTTSILHNPKWVRVVKIGYANSHANIEIADTKAKEGTQTVRLPRGIKVQDGGDKEGE